ncbi:hypothetical protein [Loktanella sp. M215]|uniref:hypothetical protein n=1 Tax=Loktanella sp. M215 TaxID=2675431 RepID=UPI001F3F20E2|nr:hypothetical protein [Loktanella sp. M215]MCF7700525.1 hypothetical protein [Loktanella sp. M215]
MPSYTTAKILTGFQEIAGIGLTIVGGVVAVLAFSNGVALQTYVLPATAIAIGLTLTTAAQLTRTMIATAENTAAMLAIMQRPAPDQRSSGELGAPLLRAEPRMSSK